MKYENGPRKVRLHEFEGLFFSFLILNFSYSKKHKIFQKWNISKRGNGYFLGKIDKKTCGTVYYIFILFKKMGNVNAWLTGRCWYIQNDSDNERMCFSRVLPDGLNNYTKTDLLFTQKKISNIFGFLNDENLFHLKILHPNKKFLIPT